MLRTFTRITNYAVLNRFFWCLITALMEACLPNRPSSLALASVVAWERQAVPVELFQGQSWDLDYSLALILKTARAKKSSGIFPKRCTTDSMKNFHPLAAGPWSNHTTKTKRDARSSALTWPPPPLPWLRNFSSNLSRNWPNMPKRIISPARIQKFPAFSKNSFKTCNSSSFWTDKQGFTNA